MKHPNFSKSHGLSLLVFYINLYIVNFSRELGEDIDGIDSWGTLSEDKPTNRTEILHNIDDIDGTAALTVGDYKIVMGKNFYIGHFIY